MRHEPTRLIMCFLLPGFIWMFHVIAVSDAIPSRSTGHYERAVSFMLDSLLPSQMHKVA